MIRSSIFVTVLALVATVVSAEVTASASARRRVHRTAAAAPAIFELPASTRLMVVAPHPDDEMLGAGGLMQRVLETGGTVRVVYLTDGDGYPEGVMSEGRVRSPSAKDYRGYGRQRRREARAALAALGFGPSKYSYTFLSFPDGGLCKLTRTYWSGRRAP
jgi:LmbE family N-acetylglucosaminyl deacetylase